MAGEVKGFAVAAIVFASAASSVVMSSSLVCDSKAYVMLEYRRK